MAGIASIGPVMQIAFVPEDFDAALDHWTRVMGVGPFFVREKMQLPGMRYRGTSSDTAFTIAIAYWGDMQVELIRQDDDSPSIYRDFPGGGAVHHVCLLTDDMDAARNVVAEIGAEVLIEAPVAPDGDLLYVHTGGPAGGIIEILKPATGTLEAFAMMRRAAQDWDGSNPVRGRSQAAAPR